MTVNLILDLDGTLIDSSPGIYHSFTLACDVHGLKRPSYDDFCGQIGPPIQHIASRFFPGLDSVAIESFRRAFRHDYDNSSYRNAAWYPDVISTLGVLSARDDLTLIIVTNKPTRPASDLIQRAGLSSCISTIVGIDYLPLKGIGSIFPSKKDALFYFLRHKTSPFSFSVYVGDTPSDQEASDCCGLPFVAALYGFHSWSCQQRPKWCIHSFAEIAGVLRDIIDQSIVFS